jgi:hypothetical protein
MSDYRFSLLTGVLAGVVLLSYLTIGVVVLQGGGLTEGELVRAVASTPSRSSQ